MTSHALLRICHTASWQCLLCRTDLPVLPCRQPASSHLQQLLLAAAPKALQAERQQTTVEK